MKEGKNNTILLIIIIIMLAIIIFLGYKLYNENNKTINNDTNRSLNINNNLNETTNVENSSISYTTFNNLGDIILDSDGTVYIYPKDDISYDKLDASYGKYTLKNTSLCFSGTNGAGIPCTFNGYKLNVNNINYMYDIEYGNGGYSMLALVSNDTIYGISYFSINLETNNIIEKTYKANIKIKTILQQKDFDGSDAVIVTNDNKIYNSFNEIFSIN